MDVLAGDRATARAGRWPRRPGPAARRAGIHLAVLAGYLAAGTAVSWPRAAYLTRHVVPGNRDAGMFVWDFWWVARSVRHLSNPWFTRYLAAPVGAQLGLHTLMPLPGVLMTPVTIVFGPSFSYNLLSAAAPGLMCYAMYRAARLWLRSQAGALAAGAFFGLSTILMWNAWYELNIALGAVFLPLALEAVVRLGRRPGWRQAVTLGVVLGTALLTDQESAIMAGLLTIIALLPWLARRPARGGRPGWVKLRSAALAAGAFAVVASPQIIAIAQQTLAGNSGLPPHVLAVDYVEYAAAPGQIFSPSPRVAAFGWKGLAAYYYRSGQENLPVTAYGLALLALAVAGLVACWRRRSARRLALLWLACTILALGTGILVGRREYVPAAEMWHGIRVSLIMPYTWMVRVPLLSSFREANRFLELGLVPLALLAGAAVDWLRYHAPVLLLVLVLAIPEAGSAGADIGPPLTMPTALPALDRPIAADRSGSIVVDVPFGVRGGVPLPGQGPPFNVEAMLQGTADGHPRSVAWLARLPETTVAGINRQPFYADLLKAQHEPRVLAGELLAARRGDAARLAAARLSARQMRIGWAIVWTPSAGILRYLRAVGFRFDYRADGAEVYISPW